MIKINEKIKLKDRLTTGQKLLLILQENIQIRDSYDAITNEFYRRYKNSTVSKLTLERTCRAIQYDIGLYPPTDRVVRRRKKSQEEIINSKMRKERFKKEAIGKKGFFQKVKIFFKKK